MTAAVGLPTLRLVRWSIGDWAVAGIAPGQFEEFSGHGEISSGTQPMTQFGG
jgi:23S rRNA pseudouridine2457 synthase